MVRCMSPRRRSKKNEKLPPYVYLKKGRYVIVSYDPDTRKQKERRLCAGNASLSEVWSAYESLHQHFNTFKWLSDLYQKSQEFSDKANSTRKAYRSHARTICRTQLKDGRRLGELPLQAWTQPVVKRYIDKRHKNGASVSGNREKAYISLVFSWAIERGKGNLTSNPAKGVRRNKERSRTRYVTDQEYGDMLELARRYAYVPPIMELAYLLRARLAEVLDITRHDLLDEGIYLHRRKGSRDAITSWSTRLRAAVVAAKTTITNPFDPHILQSKDGARLRESTAQTAWGRIMREQWPGERFTIHDLKAKGITDTTGDKQKAGGHIDPKMTAIYDRKPLDVDPTR